MILGLLVLGRYTGECFLWLGSLCSREEEFFGQARTVKELSGKFIGYLLFTFTITVLSFPPFAIWGFVCLFGYG